MKIAFLYLFLGSLIAVAQPVSKVMQGNQLQVRLSSEGLLKDSAGVSAIRNNSGMSLIERAGVWMSATDSLGQKRIAVHDVLRGLSEFWPGPLTLSNEQPANSSAWNKVFSMSKNEIIAHQSAYKNMGYVPSLSISEWPGSLGAPYAQVLAPFVDLENNNQVYEPLNGDYPYTESDALLLAIDNDRLISHTISGGLPLGVELHTLVMAFSDSSLRNCLVVRYSVFNRSPRTYKNFKFSSVLNFKIGDLDNEYLGTEIGARAIYAINDTSEATFSKRLVSIGCMALNKSIQSSMYFENNSDPINGQPDSAQHYMNLMHGQWKNGKGLNFGSNGVDGSGFARFVYPDTTDALHSNLRWIDQVPGEKFGILNFDSVELKAGSATNYDLAFFYVDENFKSLKQIGDNCLKIKQVLNTKNSLKMTPNSLFESPKLTWFPNPVKIGDKLNLQTELESPDYIRLMDLNGKEICKLDLEDNDKSIILPLDLNAGVYMIECKTLNSVNVYKLILTH